MPPVVVRHGWVSRSSSVATGRAVLRPVAGLLLRDASSTAARRSYEGVAGDDSSPGIACFNGIQRPPRGVSTGLSRPRSPWRYQSFTASRSMGPISLPSPKRILYPVANVAPRCVRVYAIGIPVASPVRNVAGSRDPRRDAREAGS